MKNTFDFEVSSVDRQIFYILPLAACDQCLKMNIDILERLNSDNSKITMILIGTTNDDELSKRIQLLTVKFKAINDKKSMVYKYETGLSKPLLVHIDDGECRMMKAIADSESEYISKYITENLP